MLKERDIDEALAAIVGSASGDDEVLRAFQARLSEVLRFPAMALLTGRRVQIVGVDYRGSTRRGLTVDAFEGDRRFTASILDVSIPGRSAAALTLAALKRWAGVDGDEPTRAQIAPAGTDTIEACVTKVGSVHVRLRALGSRQELTYRSSGIDVLRLVPGHIVQVKPSKRWTHRGVPYITGDIVGTRIDIASLKLPPLELRRQGIWEPSDEGSPSEHEHRSLRALWQEIASKSRIEFEMEQVLPGFDPDDVASDPVIDASEQRARGERDEARDALLGLLHQDLRCLDAHAHLGNWAFEVSMLDNALGHYQVGVGLGDQAIGEGFSGILPWGLIDNRPFLRCLNGLGLTLWRLRQQAAALAAFERLLRLNPRDEQGARLNWTAIQDGRLWEDEAEVEHALN